VPVAQKPIAREMLQEFLAASVPKGDVHREPRMRAAVKKALA
jgi:hypothetical protein